MAITFCRRQKKEVWEYKDKKNKQKKEDNKTEIPAL